MANYLICLTILGIYLFNYAEASKILLITLSTYSHCAEVGSVGQELANRGHNVSILLGSNFHNVHNNCFRKGAIKGRNEVQPILLNAGEGVLPAERLTMILAARIVPDEEVSVYKRIDQLYSIIRSICAELLSDVEAIASLEKLNFDLAIVDASMFTYCYYAIPYKLNIPSVAMSTAFHSFVIGQPFLPSVVPDKLSRFTDKMSFSEKLQNAFSSAMMHALNRFVIPMDIVNKLTPGLTVSSLINLVSNSELILYNYHPILNYPEPRMPNVIFVGGISTCPEKPLTEDLAEFYNKSQSGVVVVSFGGNSLQFPDIVIRNLVEVFKKLNLNILWKHLRDEQSGNIKQTKWLPQSDVLAHPRTKLFVSHCGNNGLYDALHHGVPVVCTPIYHDQFYNAARVEQWGVGKAVSLLTATAEQLSQAINEVLNDHKYAENMKKASSMYHSQPMTPRDTAAFWVEYILKFGGSHLRAKSSEMSLFSYMGYDIMCFIIILILIVFYLMFKCIFVLCKRCKRTPPKVKTN